VQKLLGRLVLVGVIVFGLWYVLDHGHGASSFGCRSTGAVAHADNSDCPTGIDTAADDGRWAEARWATVKDQKVTTGLFYDHDGAEHTYVSGEDDDASHAGDVLRQVGAAASPIGTYPTATHVEIKAAVSMRDAGESRGVIVINNPTGPCPGNLGCTAALPRVLPSGATLVVWWRNSSGAMHSQRFTGGTG
jgi:hypothetical protein